MENHGNGVYSLRSNGNRSYYLDVDGAQDVNERNVQIYANSNQRFRLRWYINTVYTSITPDFSNTKSLDVYGGSDASRYNTNVQIYSYTHSSNQFWEFEEVNNKENSNANALDLSIKTLFSISLLRNLLIHDTNTFRKSGMCFQ